MAPTTQPLSCQLCAIPFSLGRTRTIHEPLTSSLDPLTFSPYHLQDATHSRCSRNASSSGCQNIVVEKPNDVHAESRWQHLAGEGCVFEGAYSGWRIGREEMRGAGRVRFVVGKGRVGGEGEDGDGDGDGDEVVEEEEKGYERESQFFISEEIDGLFLEGETVTLPKPKYGVRSFTPQNFPTASTSSSSLSKIGIPIHSACYTIFTRISLQKLGHIDLDGLASLWHRKACGGCGFTGLTHDPVIRDLKERFWIHRPGTEYLAANPVEIPGLRLAMQGVYSEVSRGGGVFGGVPKSNLISKSQKSKLKSKRRNGEVLKSSRNRNTDPFAIFPLEMKNKILSHLSPVEISSLRLSTRAFRQPPQQIFRSLIEQEMPWFWEIDEIRAEVEKDYADAFREEFGSVEDLEMLEGLVDGEWLAFVRERMEGKREIDVNWFGVYKTLKVMEGGRKGVRNRRRVWGLVGEVVGMIGERRGEFELDLVGMKGNCGGKEGRKDFSSCPACEKVQIELESEEEDSEDEEEEDSEEDSCGEESSSEEESSITGESSVGESSEDACSSGEDEE
ncbi:hypothetical protein BKA64DRAFT_737538 [Cadophora sp. MPI-SDFR-AT-0126]|nr:hypothetical protein BKA64DRAFT_737538 [Leotiomycetes sp. MPI-SDFR-AT-0126]